MRKISSFVFLGLLSAVPLAAQQTPAPPAGEELVDRVVAVVGDTVLLLSDIQTELQQLQASGRTMPTDPVAREALGQQILESRVNDMILLEAAKTAGITPREDEITGLVEQDLREVQRRFGSQAAFEAALSTSGMRLDQYREMIASRYRSQQMVQQFLAQRMRNRARPLISEEQVRASFDTQQAALGTRPATVSFRQVIIEPQPTDSARAAARAEAEDVLRQLGEGGDFQVLARRFSDDPGSKEQGGDLGWFRRGSMVKEFEEVAYALSPGQTSGIVESDFGFHIIKLEKARAGERQARHILISPDVTPADVERAREKADSIGGAVRAGASITELAREYGTAPAEAEVVRAPIERLPAAYVTALQSATADQVIGPLELESPRGSAFAVVKVTTRQESGAYTLDDIREQIRTRLQEEVMMEQLVQDLRQEMYVAVQQ